MTTRDIMKDRLLSIVKQFLRERPLDRGPLLLAFSGGPDSLALLHLALKCRPLLPCDLEVAHVDHGWRLESRSEADELSRYVAGLGLKFHLCRLGSSCQGEEAARKARLEFFKSLQPQAVLLAHHADDQSETVLKRIFEGAHFTSLGGIRPVAFWEGMALWRPLLGVRKKELLRWLSDQGLKGLEDPTNCDPKFLRSRMRKELFPDLAKSFGKEIVPNLCRLGSFAEEVGRYLEKKIEPYWALVQRDSLGSTADLEPLFPFERVELELFLKKWCSREGVFLSHAALSSLVVFVEQGKGRKKIEAGGRVLEIYRRKIAIKI